MSSSIPPSNTSTPHYNQTTTQADSNAATNGANVTQGVSNTNSVGSDTGATSDRYALTGSGSSSSALQSSPPVTGASRPSGQQGLLSSASAKLGTAGAVSTPTSAALLMAETGQMPNQQQQDDTESKAASTQTQSTLNSQAQSILDSTSQSTQHKCKTSYTNESDNVQKLQSLGFSKTQAQGLVQSLQDSRTPESTKQQLAYQLAAIGMGGDGQSNTSATASNATALKSELGHYGDEMNQSLNGGGNSAGIGAGVGAYFGGIGAGIGALMGAADKDSQDRKALNSSAQYLTTSVDLSSSSGSTSSTSTSLATSATSGTSGSASTTSSSGNATTNGWDYNAGGSSPNVLTSTSLTGLRNSL